jgi:hypothetical protein
VLEKTKDPFDSGPMRSPRGMEVLTNFVHRIGNIWPSQCEVLESPNNASVLCVFTDEKIPLVRRELGACGMMCGDQFT